MKKNNLKLKPGKFYYSKNNEVWCCFSILEANESHCQAYCIRILDHRVEYFYLDGRYDTDGKREHCLIKEVENQ